MKTLLQELREEAYRSEFAALSQQIQGKTLSMDEAIEAAERVERLKEKYGLVTEPGKIARE